MRYAHSVTQGVLAQSRAQSDLARHLASCIRENDPGLLAAALGAIARIEGFTWLSRETGISRTSLYRVLTEEADPSFSVVLKVVRVLGFRLCIEALPLRGRRA